MDQQNPGETEVRWLISIVADGKERRGRSCTEAGDYLLYGEASGGNPMPAKKGKGVQLRSEWIGRKRRKRPAEMERGRAAEDGEAREQRNTRGNEKSARSAQPRQS